MRYKSFLQYQCTCYLLRWRWLIPIPIGLLLGYWASQVIKVLNPGSLEGNLPGTGLSGVVLQGNAFEAFLWAFGKPEIVYFIGSAIYIYLISDYLPAPGYEQWLLIRLGSRSRVWLAKVCLVFLSTWVYAALLFGSFFSIVLTRYPFSRDWSPAGLNNFGLGLGYATKNGGPVTGALLTGAFLILGWFAIGLLILTVNQITHKSWTGFLSGALIIVLADLGSVTGGPIGGEGWLSYLLIQNHLEYTPLWAPVRMIPESASWIFWTVWIFLCCVIGWVSSKQGDLLAIER
jgi:hypothetical protein